MVAPFYTALTTLVALPPAVTPEGVTGLPADRRYRPRGRDR